MERAKKSSKSPTVCGTWGRWKGWLTLDFWTDGQTTNPRQWQGTLGAGTAALGVEGLHEWRTGTTSPDQGRLHQQLCILQDVSQSIFLLFALIICYGPFCRRTRMGSKESIVSMVQSVHNTSRDSFNGNFNKGGFCDMKRHSLRIEMEVHSIQFTE